MDEKRQKQDDELLVLQAIYEDDVEDLRLNDPWKVWRPVELLIHLRPSGGASGRPSDVYVGVDLHVNCSLDYPDCPPKISLANEKGLSKTDVATLQSILISKSEELKQQEMLLELCQIVQTFLYEKNAPPEYVSFHEGMEKRRERQLQQRKTEEQLLRDSSTKREAEEIAAELTRRQDELRFRKDETEMRQRSYSEMIEQSPQRERRSTDLVPSKASTPVADSVRVPIIFAEGAEHAILRSRVPELLRPAPHRFCVEWSGTDELTGAEVFVSEWTFECQLGKKTNRKVTIMDEFVNLLSAVEKEAQALFKLSSHANVCRYLALDCSRRFVTGKSFAQKIFVVRSMADDEQPLSRTLESRVKLSAEQISKIAKCMLSALHFLHTKDILHKYILPDCIWEVPERGHLLSDYYLRHRMLDVADCFCACTQLPKEERAVIAGSGKSSRRNDIFCLGTVLTALANGEWSPQRDLLPRAPLMADASFVDFLSHCFGLEADCWTASRLLEHSFIVQGPANSQKTPSSSLAMTTAASDEEFPLDGISVGGQQSRLGQEFSVIKWLGKGGFGDVILVRNKLDGGVYAIKRIPLNPRSKELNKKITREAKLFSRLNHENVVRYYNSWIEATTTPEQQKNGAVTQTQMPPENDSESFLVPNLRAVEANAPAMGNSSVEWSVSYMRTRQSSSSSSDSADESLSTSNPVGVFASSFYGHRSSQDSSDAEIIFEGDASSESDREADEIRSNTNEIDGGKDGAATTEDTTVRVLYIQMEFCERSTLRRLIDALELTNSPRRIWRLFREMLEGLKYIHNCGMIHRDIKPVNIFLDGQDHVKIGDFGLATQGIKESVEAAASAASLDDSCSHGLTTDVGTALYVAPELIFPRKSGIKAPSYTFKVDIFSAGIVLFEMFYRPLEAGMERLKTLTDMRNGPHFPSDFGISLSETARETAKKVISWTLTAEAVNRPTAEELLLSKTVPMVEMRETEFQMAFTKAISDERSRLFRWMMDSLFNRLPSSTLDYCFDQDIYKDASWVEKALKMNRVERKLAEMFRIHGIVPIVTPLLTPASVFSPVLAPNHQLAPCHLIDKSGLIVSLPYDLRYGFARLAARNPINRLKRYAFGKAYRSDNNGGAHPKEIAECAVDFLTSAVGAAASTAELMFILHQIARDLVGVHGRRCAFRVGHVKLVRAAVLHAGIVEENEQIRVIRALPSAMDGNKGVQRFADQTGLPLATASTLYEVLKKEGPLDRILAEMRVLTRTNNALVSKLAKEALGDLDKIKTALDIFLACDKGVETIPLTVAVGLVQRPDVYMDGVVFTLSAEILRKKKKADVVIAVGGRYDNLVKAIRQGHLDPDPPASRCAVGCSLWMDQLTGPEMSSTATGGAAPCSVLVCSQSGASLVKEKLSFIRQLWTAGIPADILHEPVDEHEDLAEYCRSTGIAHLATMLDADSVLLKTFDEDRDREIKFSRETAVDVIRGEMKPSNADSVGGSSLVPSSSSTKLNAGDTLHAHHVTHTTSVAAATFANVKIRYAMLERPPLNTRKRVEMQIWAVLGSTVSKYSSKTTIDVLASELPLSVVRAIAGVVDSKCTAVELSAGAADVCKRFNKYKREVQIVFDELRGVLVDVDRSVLGHTVVIVYGKEAQAEEGFCRVIL